MLRTAIKIYIIVNSIIMLSLPIEFGLREIFNIHLGASYYNNMKDYSNYLLFIGKLISINFYTILPLFILSIICFKRNYSRKIGIFGLIAVILGAIGLFDRFTSEF